MCGPLHDMWINIHVFHLTTNEEVKQGMHLCMVWVVRLVRRSSLIEERAPGLWSLDNSRKGCADIEIFLR